MRRLAAVFAGRRSDKSDAGSSVSNAERSEGSQTTNASKATTTTAKGRAGFFRSLSKGSLSHQELKGRKHQMPPVSTMPDHAGSSASSSSGGPRTPSDDHESIIPVQHAQGRRSWLSQVSDVGLPLPPLPPKPTARPYVSQHFNSRDADPLSETSSESDDVYEQDTRNSNPVSSPNLPLIAPAEYFCAITANAVLPPYAPPPLLQLPSGPLYPRSCNHPRQLRPSDSLYARVLRKRLLGRLDRFHESSLTGFANRRNVRQIPSLVLDDVAIPKTARVQPFSSGLRRWTERPCFEDRVIVYLPAEGGDDLRAERVYASAAVEALGYSEHIEALAGLYDDIGIPTASPVEPPSVVSTTPFPMTSSTTSLSSAPPSPPIKPNVSLAPPPSKPLSNASYKSTPSPLRKESTDTIPDLRSNSAPTSVGLPAVVPTALPSPPVPRPSSISPPSQAVSPRPAVRFVEDEKDDSIPLDYVMRVKQARDKKARFLAAERARRLSVQDGIETPRYAPSDAAREDARRLTEERRRIEQERRQLEDERRKWERERAARERVDEEKRKKQLFAEELVEARRRQEKTRQGAVPKMGEGTNWEGDRERDRERRGSDIKPSYHRARYDSSHSPLPLPQRQSSEPNIYLGTPQGAGSRLSIPYPDSSPGSSRPPSIATGSNRGSSRPPSMYSTPPSSASATDVRTRRESKASRRSVMSETGSHSPSSYFPVASPTGYPWGVVPPVPAMPMGMNMNMPMMAVGMPMMQMPVMPYTDMPLIPPTPPFVLQQYKQRGPGSNYRSYSSSPTRPSGSDSNKRHSGGTGRDSPHSTHRRVPSDDVSGRGRNGSHTHLPPQPSSSSSRSARPSMPVSQSQPLPHNSAAPSPMTSSWPRQPAFQNLSRPSANRRQTMIT